MTIHRDQSLCFYNDFFAAFDQSNLLASILVFEDLCQYLPSPENVAKLAPVPGRMQKIGNSLPLTFVDFAHTPESLRASLLTLRERFSGPLWLVFGCGGNRDAQKRPVMGRIASELADMTIVTSDNPREEKPEVILHAITKNWPSDRSLRVEEDRKKAIAYALEHAPSNAVILIAGKGHEAYQLIGKEKLPFSDQEIALQYLEQRNIDNRLA